MRIFYSELAENPAYYSFGYSVYAELAEDEDPEPAFQAGFLPCVIASEQSRRLMYQTRGVRILVKEFTRRHYHERVARKASALGALSLTTRPVAEYANDVAFKEFVLRYFAFRFGKDSMPSSRLDAILASGWVTQITECCIDGKVAAYMLEHAEGNRIHVWYQAYAKQYEHAHLGSYLYVDLMERAKVAGKEYVYFGVTYGPWMKYKANFAPLEYWNGAAWVRDGNGKLLKARLDAGVVSVPYVDEWRSAHEPFYPAPQVAGFTREARFLQSALDAAPRLTLLILLVPFLLVVIAFLRSW